MKIVYDHQIFAHQSYGGISRYFVQLAHGLAKLGSQVDILAPIHRNRYLKDLPTECVHGLEFVGFPPRTGRLISFANNRLSELKLRNIGADLLHETYYTVRPISTVVKARVITVHDMIHEKFAQEFSPKDLTTSNKLAAVKRADHIICISESTKRDLCDLFNVADDRVSVVHHGVGSFAAKEHSIEYKKIDKPFLLYVGARGGYKNFSKFLEAIAQTPTLKNAFNIIAFGGGPFNSEERSIIGRLNFSESSIIQIGGGDDLLCSLYKQASALVYPSLYEGFGLPPLEAMAHDCPVVSSNTSSMPEVIGSAGEYFDPANIEDMANAIVNVVFNDKRKADLLYLGRERLNQFSWTRCASETLKVYKTLLPSIGLN